MNKQAISALVVTIMVLLWIGLLSGCASKWKPAQQQKDSTPHTSESAIPVHELDLNQDGHIDQSEQQIITQDRPAVLTTFMCIGALVVAVCGLCVLLSRSRTPASRTTDGGAMAESPAPTPTPSSSDTSDTCDSDEDMWCHAEQDFLGTDPHGKRVRR